MSDKTKLSTDDVKHVAKLSRLGLTDEEIRLYTDQLSSVLEYIDKLNEVDTEKIEGTAQVTDLKNVLRKDEIKPCLSQEEALSSSTHAEDGYFKVKAVI